MLSRVYLVVGLLIVALYALVAFSGMEFGNPERQRVPPEVRDSRGYRSFHFWHSGYRGGK